MNDHRIYMGQGVDDIRIGMQMAEVKKLLDDPSKEYRNEFDQIEWVYNEQKMCLVFEQADETYALDEIHLVSGNCIIDGVSLKGISRSELLAFLEEHRYAVIEEDDYGYSSMFFCERAFWEFEFGSLTDIVIL